jgi:hypothetical protein
MNAVLLPSWIAPNAVHKTAHNIVAGTGQDNFVLTLEKYFGNGVALSRARVHHSRPTIKIVPIVQIMMDRNRMNNSPNVAPSLPVA